MPLTRFTDGYKEFNDAEYVEDASVAGGIVLTMPKYQWRNTFSVDYRGSREAGQPWKTEYFCEPDTVLLIEDENAAQGCYLPYLARVDDLWANASQARAAARFAPGMGAISALLPVTTPLETPLVDMTEMDILRAGSGRVETQITIKNCDSGAKRTTYVYQDAAYMWFPDGNQVTVETMRLQATPQGYIRDVNLESAGPTVGWQFAGTFSRARGIVSGLLSFEPSDILGVSAHYIGISGAANVSYFTPTPGYRRADVPAAGLGGAFGPTSLKNRFVAMDFGTLQPGQSQTRVFYRIMTVLPEEQRNEQGIHDWVRLKVMQHYGLV
jgi:hypothetical protein